MKYTWMAAALAVLTLIASSGNLEAQKWSDSPGTEPKLYENCALRLVGDELVRGDYRETIATADRFTLLPLKRFVTGDSALRYAALYERDGRRAASLRFVASLFLLAGSFTNLAQHDRSAGQAHRLGRGMGLALVSAPIYLVSLPFRARA